MSPQSGKISIRGYVAVIWITLIASSEGIVTSNICPGGPNFVTSSTNYTVVDIDSYFSTGQSCTWVIERDDCSGGGGVEVDINRLYYSSYSDSVIIYDGHTSLHPAIETYHIPQYSRHNIAPRRSSGRFITVVFMFKYDHNQRRFQLRYRNTPKGRLPSNAENRRTENAVSDTCGDELLVAYQKPNFITSPGYPREYGNSLDCKWTVKSDDICNDDVIQVTIHTLALEEKYDHLVIYDGDTEYDPVLTKLSGNEEPQVIMASGTSIVIEFKTDDTAPGRGFHLSYIRTRATPSLSQSVTIKLTERVAEMSVDFISSTPHRAVYWSKNDVILTKDDKHKFSVTSAKVASDLEPDVTVDGFRATLVITGPEPQDFGMYKMAVANEFGVGERTVFLRRGNSVPIIHNYTVFAENATIIVTFSSNPNFEAEWYKTQRILTSGSDVHISTERDENDENADESEARYKSVLSPANPTEPDYGEYMFIIRNDIVTAEVYIYTDLPKTELPKLVTPSAVELSNRHITLSVTFDSNIAYPTATWYHGNVQLGTSDKYRPELIWKGLSSSDWLTNGYPSILNSTVFKRVARTHDNQHYVSDYRYPSIGGSRSSTHPNANYTAVLTISDMTPDDFGVYRVVLENDAGISHHVIDVTTPEVFPYATCDQADTIRLVCNVTSCSSTIQSWIHSVDGDVIRHLPGHQDGPVNMLTIPMCMHSDAGTYTCVATDEETGSDVTIHHDRTTLTVRAVAVIMDSTVNIQSDSIHIEVPFYCHPPHHRIRWQLNGDQVSSSPNNTMETEPRDVNLPMHGKKCSHAGHVTSMSVPEPRADDFGIYKITIANEMGNSEHFVKVQNPAYANPVTSSDVIVSYDGGSALLNVTFSSYYSHRSVKWYFRGHEVRENHPVNKYVIETDPAGDVIDPSPVVRTDDTKSTILTVTCVADEDYGRYDVIVSNKAGNAMIPVRLTEHEQGIPKMIGEMVTHVSNSTGEIYATFYSSPSHRLIRWLKEGKEIANDSSKYNIVHEDVDIEISSNGETVKKTGTITRLILTSLDDNDYGLYSVRIYNDVGMTHRSVTLGQECT